MGLTDRFSFTSYPAFQVLMLSEGSIAVVGGKGRSASSPRVPGMNRSD